MFIKNQNVEAVSTSTNYSFTAIPNNFIYLLDIYCYKLFATLMQKESYWKNNNQLTEDGYFSMRIEDIEKSLGCQTKEINSTIEALYCCGLISVISVGTAGKRITNKYKINWNKVIEFSAIPIQQILDNDMIIKKCRRGTTLTYRQQTEVSTQVRTTPRTNCHTTIENINNIDNKLTNTLADDNNINIEDINDNLTNEVNNINIDNSDVESVNEVIELRNVDNINGVNEMNEMKETNTDDTNINIPTLYEVLSKQAEEDNEVFNNFNVSVNKFNKEEQERYSRLFANTKALIEEWYKSHDGFVKAQIETNIKVINMMYENGDISVKQFNTAQEKLNNHFNKLLNGHLQFLKNKRNPIISNNNPQPPRPEENENKAVLSHENAQGNKTISQSKETQQDANKRAKMAIAEMGDEFKDEYNRISTVINGNYNVMDIAKEMENYFNLCRNCNDWNLCIKWYDTLELIINKYADWFKCGDLANAIYSIANPIMDNKNNNLNK